MLLRDWNACSVFWPILVLTVACGGGGDGSDPGMGGHADAGTSTDRDGSLSAACAPAEVPVCGDDAPTLGAADQIRRDTFSVEWKACEDSDISVGPWLLLEVPEDIISLSITVEDGALPTGILRLQGSEGLAIDEFGEPPFFHFPTVAGSVTLPTDFVTYPEPGCMAVLPMVGGDQTGRQATVHVVSKRGDEGMGGLGINLIVGDEVDIYQDELDGAIYRMDDLLRSGNAIGIESTEIYGSDVSYVDSFGASIDSLRAMPYFDDDRRINVFLVADFLDEQLAGIAGGIPGPVGVSGTAASGVVVSIDSHRLEDGSVNTNLLGETLAHEVGHQMGLFHTTEADGLSHDPHEDTPECAASADLDGDDTVTATECWNSGGPYMMFWAPPEDGSPQETISPLQSDILFYSPITR